MLRWVHRAAGALACAALLCLGASPAVAAPELEPLGTFQLPVHATAPPGDLARVFVVEKEGTVRVVRDGVVLEEPFLDVGDEILTEYDRGLQSIAFAPDYAESGLFYVFLTAKEPTGEVQVREYRRSEQDPDVAEPDGRIVLRQAHAENFGHNGGQLAFGPDGLLYVAIGDGGLALDVTDNAQRLDTQLGKLLRIDPRPTEDAPYAVPADNPYAAPDDGAVDTIWARGLRNPWRFSFDRETGDLWLGDVGDHAREEIDLGRFADGLGRGANYGWRCYEGSVPTPGVDPPCEPPDHVLPVFEYDRWAISAAVTAGVVVRDVQVPSLFGRFLFADLYREDIRSLAADAPAAGESDTGLRAASVVSFGEDGCGRVLVVSIEGPVSRVREQGLASTCPPTPPPPPPPPAASDQSASADDSAARSSGGGAAAADGRAPGVGLTLSRRMRLRDLALRVRVRCDEPCRLTAAGRIVGAASLRTVKRSLGAPGATTLALRPSARRAQALRRALRRHRRLRARIAVQATDAAGNVRRVARRVTVGG